MRVVPEKGHEERVAGGVIAAADVSENGLIQKMKPHRVSFA